MTAIAAGREWTPYCGAAPLPGDWLARWNADPLLLAGLALLFWAWWRRRDEGAQPGWFLTAYGLLLVLFVSPFCALTSALFSARVVHHVLLTAAVAPLLAMAVPSRRLPAVGPLWVWTGVQAALFWAWHAPDAYAAALSSDAVYWLMQATLLGSSLGFWLSLRRSGEPGVIAALLVSLVQMGLLGALITFAGKPLYAPHFLTTASWGLNAIEDQQLGGLIMWAPAAGFYLAAALTVAAGWLKREEAADGARAA